MMGTKGSAPEEPNVPNAIQANVLVNTGSQAATSTNFNDQLERRPAPDARSGAGPRPDAKHRTLGARLSDIRGE